MWAISQTEGEELKAILDGKVEFSDKLDKVLMPEIETLLYCKTSGVVNRFYVPQIIRKKVFQSMYGLSLSGIWAARQLICLKYIWLGINVDVALWCRACIPC